MREALLEKCDPALADGARIACVDNLRLALLGELFAHQTVSTMQRLIANHPSSDIGFGGAFS
jgi:hypothetical protein